MFSLFFCKINVVFTHYLKRKNKEDFFYLSLYYLLFNYFTEQIRQRDGIKESGLFFTGTRKVPLSIFCLDSVLFMLDSVGVRGFRVWTNTYVFSLKYEKKNIYKSKDQEYLDDIVEIYNDFNKLNYSS